MAVSQNGWTAYASGLNLNLASLKWITGKVRRGDVHKLFDLLCARFNREVEPITKAHSWGFAPRPIRGSKTTSNHASGTAIDLNAPKHPLGKRGTFTAAQVKAIRAILKDCGGVVRWGGDYKSRADEMHFEIVGSAAQVKAAVNKLAAKPAPKPTPAASKIILQRGDKGAKVGRLQAGLNRVFPAYRNRVSVNRGKNLARDNSYGPAVEAWVKVFQAASGLKVTGKIDTATAAALARHGIRL